MFFYIIQIHPSYYSDSHALKYVPFKRLLDNVFILIISIPLILTNEISYCLKSVFSYNVFEVYYGINY